MMASVAHPVHKMIVPPMVEPDASDEVRNHAIGVSTPAVSDRSATPRGGPDQRTYAVHIRFPASRGPRLRRKEPTTCGDGQPLWEERPLLLRRGNGVYELIGTSSCLSGLARWVLSFGSTAEVQSPARLRRLVIAEARRVLHVYDPASDGVRNWSPPIKTESSYEMSGFVPDE
jgi:hypothetical protein